MIQPRSNSDEDLVACAIDCLALWRRRGAGPGTLTDEAEAEVTASLAAIRPRLAALELPDGLLAAVDAAIGQDLEEQWSAPAATRTDGHGSQGGGR